MNESPRRHFASALLPWYVNGALAPDQHAMVREHVESCDLCAAEHDNLQTVARSAIPAFGREPAGQAVSPSGEPANQGRRAWVLAVVLALPAILGLVWVLVGVARGR